MSEARSEITVQPQISIITVCLNSKKTIERTIKSVISQKTEGIEYIIIDGGSSDGTQDVVRSYGSSVDVFISESDMGIADAFNKGISFSKGEIIGLINSDDCLLPGTLKKIDVFFHKNPDSQVVHGDLLLYSGDLLVKQVTPAGRWWYPWRLVLFNHPATFVRRSLYNEYGNFSIKFRIAMDIDIFLRWVNAGVKIDYLPEPLVAMHYGGLSDRQPYQGYLEAKRAFIDNGFPFMLVNLLYFTKCILHRIGKIHAALLLFLRN